MILTTERGSDLNSMHHRYRLKICKKCLGELTKLQNLNFKIFQNLEFTFAKFLL
jgi:hypothetical protein